MRDLRVAVSFLTRVPVRNSGDADIARAAPWFPVVGALVGAAVGGLMVGLAHLVPALVAASVSVMLGVLVTGAFHEDGLADVADAFAGGWTPEERLRILKDPHHGSYGVAALCGSIVVRIACLATLGASPAAAFACVVAAHALGRAGALLLMATMPTARSDGLGTATARSLTGNRAAAGLATGVAIVAVATGWWSAPFALAALVGTGVMARLAMRKINGVSGDVLGAAEQVIECLVLVVATGLVTRSQLWWR